jgi:hypothetical protein
MDGVAAAAALETETAVMWAAVAHSSGPSLLCMPELTTRAGNIEVAAALVGSDGMRRWNADHSSRCCCDVMVWGSCSSLSKTDIMPLIVGESSAQQLVKFCFDTSQLHQYVCVRTQHHSSR